MGIATETVSSTKPAEVIERARRAGVQVVDVHERVVRHGDIERLVGEREAARVALYVGLVA